MRWVAGTSARLGNPRDPVNDGDGDGRRYSRLITQQQKPRFLADSVASDLWGYQDLNLGPLPYQGSALTV